MFRQLFGALLGPAPKQDKAEQMREEQERALRRISPHSVEQLIDAAGRDAVFARSRELGWVNGLTPPLWVWNQIAFEILAAEAKEQAIRERADATLN